MDPQLLKNLRPVSTFPFLSKTMERVAGKYLLVHNDKNHLHEKLQSAYRDGHSMETALIQIQNDVLTAIDSKQCVFLVLLDMSAAFNTVDHSTLLQGCLTDLGFKIRHFSGRHVQETWHRVPPICQ